MDKIILHMVPMVTSFMVKRSLEAPANRRRDWNSAEGLT